MEPMSPWKPEQLSVGTTQAGGLPGFHPSSLLDAALMPPAMGKLLAREVMPSSRAQARWVLFMLLFARILTSITSFGHSNSRHSPRCSGRRQTARPCRKWLLI